MQMKTNTLSIMKLPSAIAASFLFLASHANQTYAQDRWIEAAPLTNSPSLVIAVPIDQPPIILTNRNESELLVLPVFNPVIDAAIPVLVVLEANALLNVSPLIAPPKAIAPVIAPAPLAATSPPSSIGGRQKHVRPSRVPLRQRNNLVLPQAR